MNDNNKIFVVVAVVLAAIFLFDFIFYGMQLRNLASTSGFALLAYGAYKDESVASFLGAVLVIGGFVIKYFL